jgi:hypothetical protein
VRSSDGCDTHVGGDTEQPGVAQLNAAQAARAAAFDAFAKLALLYFENPSTELRAACEAAAFVVRTMQKVG